ncbi:hypothetical protein PM082_000573 [Marasmius tenuissimus]|nr:hypothetical protein PM082_000573 [Marasmius tenuissimus]
MSNQNASGAESACSTPGPSSSRILQSSSLSPFVPSSTILFSLPARLHSITSTCFSAAGHISTRLAVSPLQPFPAAGFDSALHTLPTNYSTAFFIAIKTSDPTRTALGDVSVNNPSYIFQACVPPAASDDETPEENFSASDGAAGGDGSKDDNG